MRAFTAAGVAMVLLCGWVAVPAAADPLYVSPPFTITIGSPRMHPLAIATHGIDGIGDATAVAGVVRGGERTSGGADAFLRVDKDDGEHLWTSRFGTRSADRATGVAVAWPRSIAVVGWTTGSFGHRANAGGRDGFLRVYRPNGTLRWSRSFGTTGDETVTDVAFMSDLIVVVGSTSGTFPGAVAAGGDDAFVVTYSTKGERGWTRQFGSDQDDVVNAVGHSPFQYAIAGTTAGTIPGGDQGNLGGTDGFSAHLDVDDGTLTMVHQFGTTADDTAMSIEPLLVYDVIGGTTAGSFPGDSNAGGLDGYVAAIQYWGGPGWVTQFGSAGDDLVTGLVTDGSFAFAAGSTTGVLGGASSLGGTDGFVTELDWAGDTVWTVQFGSPGDDEVTSVATIQNSGVNQYVVVSGLRDGQPFWGLQRPAWDDLAQANLETALVIAQRWAANHGDSFADFTLANAYLYPGLGWRSGAPVGLVDLTIDHSDATSVRLSALSFTGTYFCIESVDGVVGRGHSTVWDPSSCSGGW
jgi:hypothetical protein